MSIFKQYMLSLRSLMILMEQKGGGIAEKKYITCIVGIYNKLSISKNVYRTEDGDSQT